MDAQRSPQDKLQAWPDFMGVRFVRRGVSKGVEDCLKLPALRAGHPINGHKAVSGVARLQGVEGSGMSGMRGYLLHLEMGLSSDGGPSFSSSLPLFLAYV
jgi:hypothetical protein